MEIRTIDTFLKVAATQNFSRAAQQLGYSQSAVTVQIQKLEQELDTQLFERIGRRVFLTDRGREFIPYAQELMKASHAALSFAREETGLRGRLRIGGVESVCTALLPGILLEFYRCCPEVEVVIRSGPTNDLLDLAASNELDLVLTLDRKIFREELCCEAEQPEEIVFVTLADDRYDGERRLSAGELVRLPFLLTENGAAYRYELERLLAERELQIRPILEIGNTETIINLLRRGMGVSVLPRFTVEQELRSAALTQLHTDLPPVYMHHQLLRHRGKWITRQMEVFTGLVREALAGGSIQTPESLL